MVSALERMIAIPPVVSGQRLTGNRLANWHETAYRIGTIDRRGGNENHSGARDTRAQTRALDCRAQRQIEVAAGRIAGR